ncbi:MAG: PDZ domain-containing protein [Oscillospiraceae bacterium]
MGVTFVITYTAVSQHYGASEEAQQISQKTAELYAYLDHYFIGETDAAALSDAASSAMSDAIGDEWSYYIPANQYQQHLDMLQNAYVGIGITITQDEDTGTFPIVTVTDGGPASSAGLQAGDDHHRHQRSRRDGAFHVRAAVPRPGRGGDYPHPHLPARRYRIHLHPDPGNIDRGRPRAAA